MSRWLRNALWTLVAAFAALSGWSPTQLSAQHDHDPVPVPAQFTAPIALYKVGLGTFTRPISSRNSEAQAFFNQGFQLTYAFAKPEAVRSFREAEKRDPNCAICYWGEAWALGSNLNWRLGPDEAPRAYAAIQQAQSLSGYASPKERAFIRTMTVRYVERFDPARQAEQDRAYADAMQTLAATFTDDLDAATLYAEALFLLEPRRGTRDIKSPNVQRILSVLEGVLALDIRHLGACHLYVHLTEATTEPGRAEACAEFLGNSVPGASHINHMPAHTWTQIGRWGDAVRTSLQAWQSDRKAAAGEGIATYPTHDLHMLAYAASMDGQGAVAIQAGRDYAAQTRDPTFQLLTLIRFGRFDDVLEITSRPPGDIPGAIWDFAQGYAHLRKGKPEAAANDLSHLQTIAASSKDMLRIHPANKLLPILAAILSGEIARSSRDLPAALNAFEQAVSAEEALTWDEPEPLPFAARHWLGAALIDAGRFADAERVYRADLQRHPRNGWSLLGLRQALASQGKASSDADTDFERSWARSDTRIEASRF